MPTVIHVAIATKLGLCIMKAGYSEALLNHLPSTWIEKAENQNILIGIMYLSFIQSKLNALPLCIGRVWNQILSFDKSQSYHKLALKVCAMSLIACAMRKCLSIRRDCVKDGRAVKHKLDEIERRDYINSWVSNSSVYHWSSSLIMEHMTNNSRHSCSCTCCNVSCNRCII